MAATETPHPGAHDLHDDDLRDIQGNLVGFNKDRQRLVFVTFPDAARGKAFLAAIVPQIANAHEVREFNGVFKDIQRAGGDEHTVESGWINIVLSAQGRQAIGADISTFPAEFVQGMAAQAAALGDVDLSAPSAWVAPFNAPQQVHAMVILAADPHDTPADNDIDALHRRVQQLIGASGVSELEPHQDGSARPGEQRGHEHFGFKDGISQPGIRGITASSKDGTDGIAAGEFLIGHHDQDGAVSGDAQQPPAPPAPEPGQPGYPAPAPTPPPPIPALPAWARNGSFVAYRRLRQDVPAFQGFVGSPPDGSGVSAEQLAAKLIGRWPSGAPLEHVPGLSHNTDPSTADPSTSDPAVLDDHHINKFDYAPGDEDGHHVPRAAHIRKMNPRSSTPPTKAESNRHRILRRGIPYGPEVQAGEQPYGGAPVQDERDRGLLFICYQASIARGFAFLQQTWANGHDFPQPGDGQDPIISQNVEPRDFNLTPQNIHLSMARWVFTTAGEYFFSPSISALKQLSG
jgi:Dyp-type peroxidase family